MTIARVIPLFDGDFFSMKFFDDETNTPLELDYRKTEFGESYRILVEVIMTRIHVVGMALGEFYVDIYDGFKRDELIRYAKEELHMTSLSDDLLFEKIMSVLLNTLNVDKGDYDEEEFQRNVDICLDMMQYANIY